MKETTEHSLWGAVIQPTVYFTVKMPVGVAIKTVYTRLISKASKEVWGGVMTCWAFKLGI